MTLFASILIITLPGLFSSYRFSLEYLIKSFLFIPYYVDGHAGPILDLGWTLYFEMFFYLIFWISSKISFKYRGQLSVGIIIIIVVLGRFISLPTEVAYYTNPILMEFAFGIFLYFLWDWKKTGKGNRIIQTRGYAITAIQYILFAIGLFSMELLFHAGFRPRFLFCGVIATIIVGIFVFIDKYTIKCKYLITIGNTSYQLYLIHRFVVRGFDIIVGRFIHINIISSIVTIVLSILSIELPILAAKRARTYLGLYRKAH